MKHKKLCLIIFKYIPVISAFVMFIHTSILLTDTTYHLAESLVGISVLSSLPLFYISFALRFCLLHRLFIAYTVIVDSCINWQSFIGFGNWIEEARFIVFLMGFFLFATLLIRLRRYHNDRLN